MTNEDVEDADILDQLISKLTLFNNPKGIRKPAALTEDEIVYIIDRVTLELQQQPSALLEVAAPLTICGDTHGQFSDLIRIFQNCGWPDQMRYLFLGDYVDRGPYSIEVVCLVFVYKMRYPKRFFILRGNHESHWINRVYGFYDECKIRYNVELWNYFQQAFDSLPIAALVSQRIFCMHGGLSPELKNLDQLRNMQLPFPVPEAETLVCDILWADPSLEHSGWRRSTRGISVTFGEDVVLSVCEKIRVDMICRAHQVVQDGYEFFAQKKLVTVFSAPNYCGEFNNCAGAMYVDQNLHCKIRQLRPIRPKRSRKSLKSRLSSPAPRNTGSG